MSQADDLIRELFYEFWEFPDDSNESLTLAPDGQKYDIEDDAEFETAIIHLMEFESKIVPDHDMVRAIKRAWAEGAEFKSREWDAWILMYDENGSNADNYSFQGIFENDIKFAQGIMDDIGSIPNIVVVNWQATADGIMNDHESIDLPNGQKAYFR